MTFADEICEMAETKTTYITDKLLCLRLLNFPQADCKGLFLCLLPIVIQLQPFKDPSETVKLSEVG